MSTAKYRNKVQPTITFSKLTIETVDQGVKYVYILKLKIKTPERRLYC